MRPLSGLVFAILFLSLSAVAQIPRATLVKIIKAEDSRTFDASLDKLIGDPNPKTRARALLAAGRIGDGGAVPKLIASLKDADITVARTAAFALGEIESLQASDAILGALAESGDDELKARLLEAAGKIASANPSDPKSRVLGEAVAEVLETERKKSGGGNQMLVRAGITAILRARPPDAAETVRLFLDSVSPEVRADAGNAYARLRGNKAGEIFKGLLMSDDDPTVRANAARALGVGEHRDATDLVLEAATGDPDSRVRVSAVRALAVIGNEDVARELVKRGGELLRSARKSGLRIPDEKSELLEIATTLGRLLSFKSDAGAMALLRDLRQLDRMASPETETALVRIAPAVYLQSLKDLIGTDFKPSNSDVPALFEGLAELARLPDEQAADVKREARIFLAQMMGQWASERASHPVKGNFTRPSVIVNAFAEFKSPNTSEILRPFLAAEEDVETRAAISSVLGRQPASRDNFDALERAFDFAMKNDKNSDDAVLAAMDAMFAIDKAASVPTLKRALTSPNQLVRRRAVEIFRRPEMRDSAPEGLEAALRTGRWPGGTVTKLGQVTLTDADYARVASRRNGQVRAVFTTSKGRFTMELLPDDAPVTVDNFIRLARRGYFNGLEVHRVVPNFVMQDGDPDGTGSGGPGWTIRCEINTVPYDRGVVGMALSGKDTGGSQWFVTHSPQPHLDGGYTVFGRVGGKDMKVVDRIARGDRIVKVTIIGR